MWMGEVAAVEGMTDDGVLVLVLLPMGQGRSEVP